MTRDERETSKAGELLLSLADAIFVINLPSRTDRRAEFERQLRQIGLSLEHPKVILFPAVRPPDAGGFPSIGARGCFLSHLGVFEMAQEKGFGAIVVCEDDLDFARDFEARLPRIAEALRQTRWDMIYAGYGETPSGERVPGAPDLIEVQSSDPVSCTHFILYRGAILKKLPDYLRGMLLRPGGDAAGGPMHVDGALNWFRAAFPELRTLAAAPPLGVQRSSRTDIHDLRWFDRSPLTRPVVQSIRRLTRNLRT